MRPRVPRSGVLLILIVLIACTSQQEQGRSAGELVFTAIPDHNSTELEEKFAPVAAHLSMELGIPVRYRPTSNYQASVEAFKNGDVQLAWFGGLTGVQARAAVPGARAIAQGGSDPTFKSYFIAHASTALAPGDSLPRAIEGRSFTFGSESSTSGRLMPEHFIRAHTGRSPSELFGRPNSFSGSHDKTAELVAAGSFEVGALNYKTYDRMVEEGRIDPEICRVIWTTPDYPDYNWTAHPMLEETYGPGFIDKLRGVLVTMEAPELLAAVDRPEGLIPATNDDFEPIVELATELGFLR